jgi:1-acyl-sn-glycerol-3-phosphate acyltransferase
VPTHRSYLDFVLCSYLFFARPDLGIPIPYIAAATEFGRIPLLGRLLHAVHAFYLARGPRRENKELARRVRDMIAAGKTLEFFVEGTWSRSREFLTPKRGLLRCLQETGRTCTLLPVAISYDRVPEEDVFARELAGAPKPKMRLGGLVRWAMRAFRGRVALGRVHLACGAPVRLGPDTNVHAVSGEVMAELKRATVTTTYHLRAYLERFPVDGVDPAALRGAIEQRGGRVLASELAPAPHLNPLIAATLRHQFAHLFERDEPPDGPWRRLVSALTRPPRRVAGPEARRSPWPEPRSPAGDRRRRVSGPPRPGGGGGARTPGRRPDPRSGSVAPDGLDWAPLSSRPTGRIGHGARRLVRGAAARRDQRHPASRGGGATHPPGRRRGVPHQRGGHARHGAGGRRPRLPPGPGLHLRHGRLLPVARPIGR